MAALLIVGVALLASADDAGSDVATEVQTAADLGPTPPASATAEPTDVPATPSPVPTTGPVSAPTPLPTPTAIIVPVPTPEFGPTGRPSSATAVNVLTAKSYVTRPTVYDGPDGAEMPVTYTYLNGSVDASYDHFTNPTYFGNPLAMMVTQGEPGDEWAEVADTDSADHDRLGTHGGLRVVEIGLLRAGEHRQQHGQGVAR